MPALSSYVVDEVQQGKKKTYIQGKYQADAHAVRKRN